VEDELRVDRIGRLPRPPVEDVPPALDAGDDLLLPAAVLLDPGDVPSDWELIATDESTS